MVVVPALLLALALTGASASTARGPEKRDPAPQAVPGELIVVFREGVSEAEQAEALAKAGAKEKKKLGKAKAKLASVAEVKRAREELARDPRVAYAEPNYRVFADVIPNDSSFAQLWGLHNTGQTVNGIRGTADADIDAPEAWDVVRGSSSVVVGVIDTGIDFSHADLAAAQWTNPGESCAGCRTDGVDNDGNGFVDDWRGWDFANDDNDPTDDHNHGTHVAGTVAGVADNGTGVAGVAAVSLVALKFLDAGGSGTTADAVRAVNYATALGIPITNNSWGGGGYSQALYDAIREADIRGSLFVAAAGNDATDNDVGPHYPSNYELPNVISVAATNQSDQLADFSNYGDGTVDLAAPGDNVYSTIPGGSYDWYSGTSMATPHVAGAFALAKSRFPTATGISLKALVLRTVDAKSSLSGRVTSGGRLNVDNAVRCAGARVWLDSPGPGQTVAVGQQVTINAIVGCGGGDVTATVDGAPVALAPRGDGLWSGTYLPTAAGTLTISATAGGDTRTATVSVVDDYWQSYVPFQWIDATAGGTRLSLGDDASANVALPFAFEYFKQPYTSVKISSNGYLVFGGSAATEYWNEPIPTTTVPNGLAAAHWDDLNPTAGGAVWYRLVGEAPNRRLVVSWLDVPHFGGTNGATFQVILEEGTNAITYQYADTNMADQIYDWGKSATVGIENAAGTAGKQLSYNEPILEEYENATAVRYAIGAPPGEPPPPDETPPAAPTGLVATAADATVTLDWANNGEQDLAGYRIYRDGVPIATTTTSAYTDTGLANGTTYTYTVTAFDHANNESAPSASASATPTRPTSATYQPNGYTITSGTLSSGSLSSLDANDANRLVVSRTNRVAAFWARTTIAPDQLATLSSLTIDYDGHASASSVSLALAVYDWSTGTWDTVDGPRTGVTTDRGFTWTNVTNPHDYVSGAGQIRFRVRGERASSSGFTTRTDLIRFAITY